MDRSRAHLTRNLRTAGMLAASLYGTAPHAQDTLQSVEVIGRLERREDDGPVTVFSAEEMRRAGVTTVEELLKRLAANLPIVTTAQTVGGDNGVAPADLRGIGGNRTLVLLNGRRIANSASVYPYTDLNMIPFAALDRVVVLRDGASAIYGTDAISGVIDFITRDDYRGGELSASISVPQHAGGGSRGLNASFGAGDLTSDGFHVTGVVDVYHETALFSKQRACCSRLYLPERGLDLSSGTSDPANYAQTQTVTGPDGATSDITYRANPSFPSCSSYNGYVTFNRQDGVPVCRFDTAQFEHLQPEIDRYSLFGTAAWRVGPRVTARTEAFFTSSKISSQVATASSRGLSMTSASPWFPGNGHTPAPTNFTIDASLPITLNWRVNAAGPSRTASRTDAARVLVGIDGSYGEGSQQWDYAAAATVNQDRMASRLTGGYTDHALILQGVADGTLNPFGPLDETQQAYVDQALLRGTTWSAEARVATLDGTLKRLLGDWFGAGRPVLGTLRVQASKERLHYDENAVVQTALNPAYVDAPEPILQAKRSVFALGLETLVPIVSSLDADIALRRDRYDGFGSIDTHKASLRWQPLPGVKLHASRASGFRAPSLYEMYGPRSFGYASQSKNDPLLCPGGTAVAGADPQKVCDQEFQVLGGSNPAVEPEIALTNSAGIAFAPAPRWRISLDFWEVIIRRGISAPSLDWVFDNSAAFASHFVRNADGTLAYVDLRNTSIGNGLRTHGVDLAVQGHWRLPGELGELTLDANGTYVDSYEYQHGLDTFVQNAGLYIEASAIPRWRHTLALDVEQGAFRYGLVHRYTSGYEDANQGDPAYFRRVQAWSVFDAHLSWLPHEAVELTVGVTNLFDRRPPFTNQTTTFQIGYDPRLADPMGRSIFARATWKFR